MNVDEMFSKLRQILKEEKRIQLEIERLEEVARGYGGSDNLDGRKVPRPDRMENAVIRMCMKKDRLEYQRRENRIYRQRAHEVFLTLRDPQTEYILECYYIRGMTVRDIAADIGMSIGWICNKKQQGERSLRDKQRRMT